MDRSNEVEVWEALARLSRRAAWLARRNARLQRLVVAAWVAKTLSEADAALLEECRAAVRLDEAEADTEATEATERALAAGEWPETD